MQPIRQLPDNDPAPLQCQASVADVVLTLEQRTLFNVFYCIINYIPVICYYYSKSVKYQ